ncbi:MAG: glutamate-5-semialdehyde dehydrogenase [Deltaproteobacteria bacterium]|nr:glutamate-5-semialdehyde dehydrogenase [Deltaproteobacteria bacterium]MBW2393840.1 glutamate-5-semialdehyde dehydrogenase [Deltaproteobacteria bacterium]
MELEQQIETLCRQAQSASRVLAALPSKTKDSWLLSAAERLEANRETILVANRRDIAEAEQKGIATPMVRRLSLEGGKWEDMIDGLRQVARLQDPVGEISEMNVRPNGLRVGRMRIPLGVIGMIYESRPNVTVDAAALCVKAGNAVILRGGSEAFHSNQALGTVLRAAAADTGLPEDAIQLLPTTDRDAIDHLLKMDRYVDLMIPRGGAPLIRKVMRESSIPVLAHDEGVCHVFIDESAEMEMAAAIVRDSKIRQMAICNGLETLLCHRNAASRVLPEVLKRLHEEGVEIRGCSETCDVFSEAVPASDADWSAEYLDKILAVKVVDDLDAAVAHVQRFGSEHTDVIVTSDYASSQEWVRRVNSSTVGVNCSTAFSDGYRLGLGAEIGVSTSKLHAFGPMGLEGLTTRKFVLFGDGQLRE